MASLWTKTIFGSCDLFVTQNYFSPTTNLWTKTIFGSRDPYIILFLYHPDTSHTFTVGTSSSSDTVTLLSAYNQ